MLVVVVTRRTPDTGISRLDTGTKADASEVLREHRIERIGDVLRQVVDGSGIAHGQRAGITIRKAVRVPVISRCVPRLPSVAEVEHDLARQFPLDAERPALSVGRRRILR